MVIRRSIKGNLLFSWLWHGVTPLTNARADYHKRIFQQSGESTRVGVHVVQVDNLAGAGRNSLVADEYFIAKV